MDAFPLSHVRGSIRLGKAWQWCVHLVEDAERQYRLLVAFDAGKGQYWAWLGAVFGDDQALVARVEFHASHDGWHCHWKTGPIAEVPRGAVKSRFPKERRRSCPDHSPKVSRSDAFGIAYRMYNVTAPLKEGLAL